jgi:oligoendopeptidase F
MNAITAADLQKNRQFLPADFKLTDWESISNYFLTLLERPITSSEELYQWLKDRSELESMLEEDMGWRYIRSSCDTANEQLQAEFEQFVTEIEPMIAPISNELDQKFNESPFKDGLNFKGSDILKRSSEIDLALFREENIPLFTELQTKQQQYGAISGAMTVTWEGKELTLQQAGVMLQETDREKREQVYHLLQDRRLLEKPTLDALYTELVSLRHQVALNAGFENYRDYMFSAMKRFDYTKEDCFDFHYAVADAVVPLVDELNAVRKEKLGVESLRPYDLSVDAEGKAPLKPFTNGEELLEKTITCLHKVHPGLEQYLKVMNDMGHLDLESRVGKAPGGYNYPLDEIGAPFIFMNATSTLRDQVTLLHEAGHAIHSFVTRNLPLQFFKHTPSEAAELASMSMELISMEYWDAYFENPEDLKRAKREQLEGVIDTLPWVATIDAFQHWVYENPNHSESDRTNAWLGISGKFASKHIDWSGLGEYRANTWQKQLHLFEVPFYYIEYAIAQLGAVAIWRNYKQNPEKTIQQYLAALELGYSASLPEIYETAGIQFNFSTEYIKELMDFVRTEMGKLQ